MKTTQILKRLILLPLGLFKGLMQLANDTARDLENKKRFPSARIEKGVTISQSSTIGVNTLLCKNVVLNHSEIGQYSYINHSSLIQNTIIGNYCSIAHGVKIGLGSHPIHYFSTSPIFYKAKNALGLKIIAKDLDFKEYESINIGSDVWIGANVIVMDGVKIGNGAIVAAGAVVTKDVPDYTIVAGIPAKVMKYRFDEPQRNALEKTKWWLKNPNEIIALLPLLKEITNKKS